jgi:hypothetical protein
MQNVGLCHFQFPEKHVPVNLKFIDGTLYHYFKKKMDFPEIGIGIGFGALIVRVNTLHVLQTIYTESIQNSGYKYEYEILSMAGCFGKY